MQQSIVTWTSDAIAKPKARAIRSVDIGVPGKLIIDPHPTKTKRVVARASAATAFQKLESLRLSLGHRGMVEMLVGPAVAKRKFEPRVTMLEKVTSTATPVMMYCKMGNFSDVKTLANLAIKSFFAKVTSC